MKRDFLPLLGPGTNRACHAWWLAVALVVGCSGSEETATPESSSGSSGAVESIAEPESPQPSEPEVGHLPGAADGQAAQGPPPHPETLPAFESRGTLDAAMADLKIPPDWYDSVEIEYDTDLPWKDARLEIRRLLGLGGESSKVAVKLTCLYREKNDIGDGHEYPMYLYMGGEYAWAIKAYEEFTQKLLADPASGDHVHAFICMTSCYSHFDEFQKAVETLNTAMTRLPEPPWRIARQADIHDGFGDVLAKMELTDKAKQHYAEAARLYPQSNQPYGQHLLKRRAGKVQSKLDLLDYRSLLADTLKDGTYNARALGYSGDKDLMITLTVWAGKITDIKIDHAEKIDQGATTIIPQRIIAKQSLEVDAITGATVTCDGIRDGVFRALKQAGLE